jgi:tetratricopeptide (TPR) repeat protein
MDGRNFRSRESELWRFRKSAQERRKYAHRLRMDSAAIWLDKLPMPHSEQGSLAAKYVVDDLPGARQIGSRLHGILANIDTGSPVSQLARDYLKASGLCCLHALAEGRTDMEAFKREAVIERTHRMELAEIAARKAAADEAKRKAERAAASAAIFDDPAYKRRQEAKRLRRVFSLGYIEAEHYPRVMGVLRTLEQRQRLRPEDVVWLQTEAEDCWTDAVAATYHLIEAEALTEAWRVTGDPWTAVNASSHWRKCRQPEASLRLTEEALAADAATAPKVRSALATTRGGALRDVGRQAEAKALGEQAHALTPKDYRPCTLLGAVYIELGDLTAGHGWFKKAEQLGAAKAIVDHDIRALLVRMSEAESYRVRGFLLEQDSERFAWLRTKGRPDQRGPKSA